MNIMLYIRAKQIAINKTAKNEAVQSQRYIRRDKKCEYFRNWKIHTSATPWQNVNFQSLANSFLTSSARKNEFPAELEHARVANMKNIKKENSDKKESRWKKKKKEMNLAAQQQPLRITHRVLGLRIKVSATQGQRTLIYFIYTWF